jgi:predicted membrane-bound spermidine synthase
VLDFGEAERSRAACRERQVGRKHEGRLLDDGDAGDLPALFAEHAENAFVIGFGTGTSTGELAQLSETKSITVAEISSAVIAASPLFDFANHGVSKEPKVHVVHSDAYRALSEGCAQLRR